jgi:hypothetical protein
VEDLPDDEKKSFAELRKDGKATVASNGGVKTSKLRQIANGFMFTGDPEKFEQFPLRKKSARKSA